MKNKLLVLTGRSIPYVKDARPITGSVTATILWQQLEYWFDKMDGKPFFKFIEPCDQPGYSAGDSWCEELGFSPDEFRNAFSKLGTRFDSKSQFEKSKEDGSMFKNEKGEERMYAAFYDKVGRKTTYYRNDTFVELKLHQLVFGTPTSPQMEIPDGPDGNPICRNQESHLEYIQENTPEDDDRIDLDFLPSLDLIKLDKTLTAYEGAHEDYKTKKYITWFPDKERICLDLPTFKRLWLISPSQLSKLSHEQIGVVIKHWNASQHRGWYFYEYFVIINDIWMKKAMEISDALGMHGTRQPTKEERQAYGLD